MDTITTTSTRRRATISVEVSGATIELTDDGAVPGPESEGLCQRYTATVHIGGLTHTESIAEPLNSVSDADTVFRDFLATLARNDISKAWVRRWTAQHQNQLQELLAAPGADERSTTEVLELTVPRCTASPVRRALVRLVVATSARVRFTAMGVGTVSIPAGTDLAVIDAHRAALDQALSSVAGTRP